MTYERAKEFCHVRSAIFRKANPGLRYWNNHNLTFDERIPDQDQQADDWEEYDPRDDDGGSLFSFND